MLSPCGSRTQRLVTVLDEPPRAASGTGQPRSRRGPPGVTSGVTTPRPPRPGPRSAAPRMSPRAMRASRRWSTARSAMCAAAGDRRTGRRVQGQDQLQAARRRGVSSASGPRRVPRRHARDVDPVAIDACSTDSGCLWLARAASTRFWPTDDRGVVREDIARELAVDRGRAGARPGGLSRRVGSALQRRQPHHATAARVGRELRARARALHARRSTTPRAAT